MYIYIYIYPHAFVYGKTIGANQSGRQGQPGQLIGKTDGWGLLIVFTLW